MFAWPQTRIIRWTKEDQRNRVSSSLFSTKFFVLKEDQVGIICAWRYLHTLFVTDTFVDTQCMIIILNCAIQVNLLSCYFMVQGKAEGDELERTLRYMCFFNKIVLVDISAWLDDYFKCCVFLCSKILPPHELLYHKFFKLNSGKWVGFKIFNYLSLKIRDTFITEIQ